jgi:transposase
VLSHYNAERRDLFSQAGLQYLAEIKLTPTDRLVLDQLLETWQFLRRQVRVANRHLRAFAQGAPTAEAEARAALATIPGVGDVTINVVLSEIADVRRFRSAKQVVAYAGLCPAVRQSDQRRLDLGITKEGSRLLRWVLVEAAWRLVRQSPRWQQRFATVQARRGTKKAIVSAGPPAADRHGGGLACRRRLPTGRLSRLDRAS